MFQLMRTPRQENQTTDKTTPNTNYLQFDSWPKNVISSLLFLLLSSPPHNYRVKYRFLKSHFFSSDFLYPIFIHTQLFTFVIIFRPFKCLQSHHRTINSISEIQAPNFHRKFSSLIQSLVSTVFEFENKFENILEKSYFGVPNTVLWSCASLFTLSCCS